VAKVEGVVLGEEEDRPEPFAESARMAPGRILSSRIGKGGPRHTNWPRGAFWREIESVAWEPLIDLSPSDRLRLGCVCLLK